jgi:hypothetical protein
MLRAIDTADANGPETTPLSPEIQFAIKAELEAMLKAAIFAQSGRCKKFLTHVVLETLAGNAAELKERTIGVSVFNRASDYGTGDDSIVRVTANEVRKRLGQFYAESPDAHAIQIELPRGSYIPEFRIQASRAAKKADSIAVSEAPAILTTTAVEAAAASSKPVPAPAPPVTVTPEPGPAVRPQPESDMEARFSRSWVYWPVGLIVLAIVALLVWRLNTAKNVPDIWSSFLNASAPVLVCIDTHDLHAKSSVSPDHETFVDAVLFRQIIALDDAAVLSTMASILGKKNVPFRVVGAEQTSLAEFRRQPVILIGAIDNKWTLRLTQQLRYRLEVANPPGSGTGKQPIASIVDSEHPSTVWTTDLSVPFSEWKNDYAIVARIDDSTTGVPVLIEAGLGNTGSVAASELISSSRLSEILAEQPACQRKGNFEAIIETEIIDTKPGPPHVVRLQCW